MRSIQQGSTRSEQWARVERRSQRPQAQAKAWTSWPRVGRGWRARRWAKGWLSRGKRRVECGSKAAKRGLTSGASDQLQLMRRRRRRATRRAPIARSKGPQQLRRDQRPKERVLARRRAPRSSEKRLHWRALSGSHRDVRVPRAPNARIVQRRSARRLRLSILHVYNCGTRTSSIRVITMIYCIVIASQEEEMHRSQALNRFRSGELHHLKLEHVACGKRRCSHYTSMKQSGTITITIWISLLVRVYTRKVDENAIRQRRLCVPKRESLAARNVNAGGKGGESS